MLRDGAVVVDDAPEPRPSLGQVLVRTLACGICGSDRHFVSHAETAVRLMSDVAEATSPSIDLGRDVYMGHEFVAEVLEAGPGTQAPAPGTIVTSVPVVLSTAGLKLLAYNNDLPAGFSEQMLLSAPLLLSVPNGLAASHAALTEPLAVGIHAVNRSEIDRGDVAVVVGCGPVGLAVIAALHYRGIECVVASDFSEGRRRIARSMGAAEVVDPSVESVFEVARREARSARILVFEAVGTPGIVADIVRSAPSRARIVVVGVCMQPDTMQPFYASAKELDLRFSMAYDLPEFASALRVLAEGEVQMTPMITDSVALDDLPSAFERLAQPGEQAKVLVEAPN